MRISDHELNGIRDGKLSTYPPFMLKSLLITLVKFVQVADAPSFFCFDPE